MKRGRSSDRLIFSVHACVWEGRATNCLRDFNDFDDLGLVLVLILVIPMIRGRCWCRFCDLDDVGPIRL